jgi:hypothetical protein
MEIQNLQPSVLQQDAVAGTPQVNTLGVMTQDGLAQLATAKQLALSVPNQPSMLAGQFRSMANSVIDGVLNFMNSVTTIFAAPPPPPSQSVPQPDQPQIPTPQPPAVQIPVAPQAASPIQAPEVPSAPPPAAAPQSLIPSWAKIFEYTGNSEWRPGGTSQKAYIDFRPELKGKIQSLEILSPDGTSVIATGTLENVGSDGRPRYRFNKAGKDIPSGAIIKATLVPNKDGGNGGVRYIEIPNSERKFVW